MRANPYTVLCRAIEDGLENIWSEVREEKDEDIVCQKVKKAILDSMKEVLDFGNQPTGRDINVKVYEVMERAVEEGIRWGWHRAYKHYDSPEDYYVKDCIYEYVTTQVCENFDFDD
jgi:hypothetical protein